MHIRILETGEPPAPLKTRFGAYPAMFERLLAPVSPRLSFSATRVHRGEPMPALAEFDGLLITGSPAGVYEGHDWIGPSEDLIRAAAKAGKPQAGVCFGHQLMAQAFGGRVEKSDRGWGVGVHDYDVTGEAAWMTPRLRRIACAVSHQDQVIEAPSQARVLAGSAFCPNGVLEYRNAPAISFQPHPEFAHDYAEALLRHLAGKVPAGRFDDALSSYRTRSDRAVLGEWMATFFLQHAR